MKLEVTGHKQNEEWVIKLHIPSGEGVNYVDLDIKEMVRLRNKIDYWLTTFSKADDRAKRKEPLLKSNDESV